MQLARSLAQTVGRVHDPFMRGEVANKASARLGVSVADFETSDSPNRRVNMRERPQFPRRGRCRDMK